MVAEFFEGGADILKGLGSILLNSSRWRCAIVVPPFGGPGHLRSVRRRFHSVTSDVTMARAGLLVDPGSVLGFWRGAAGVLSRVNKSSGMAFGGKDICGRVVSNE